jgi:hypothetical protein
MSAPRLLAFVLLCTGSLAGQSVKIRTSNYDPQLMTNIMVATSVKSPKIDYVLACLARPADCELLAAGEYSGFTPASQGVYPSGPNLVTYKDGKRIVVLVEHTSPSRGIADRNESSTAKVKSHPN